MAQIDRKGFGQVEPNHLSGIVEGRIYAQLPVDKSTMGGIIEQGRFAKYNYAAGKVNLTGDGDWMLIYNEEHHYDERRPYHKDYAMKEEDFIDKTLVPRLIGTNVGDIYTTNTFNTAASSYDGTTVGYDLDVGDYLEVKANGYLGYVATKPQSGMVWKVVKVYTMSDGKAPGVKIQRVQ